MWFCVCMCVWFCVVVHMHVGVVAYLILCVCANVCACVSGCVLCMCLCIFVWLYACGCVCLHVYVVVCACHRRTCSPSHHPPLSYSLETESPAGPEARLPASKLLFPLPPTVTCWTISWTPPRAILKARAKPINWSSSNNTTENLSLDPFSHISAYFSYFSVAMTERDQKRKFLWTCVCRGNVRDGGRHGIQQEQAPQIPYPQP